MIFSIIGSVLLFVGIWLVLGLTTEQVTNDFLTVIKPKDNLSQKATNFRSKKKKKNLFSKIMNLKTAMDSTGKNKQFTVVCCLSIVMFCVGIVLSFVINNVFLLPVLSIAFAIIPFIYINNTLDYYEKMVKDALEITLSSITNSYIRTDDIVRSVKENVEGMKPPIKEIFNSFVVETSVLNPNIKKALYSLKDKINNDIFAEWCETVIQCQDDRTMKDSLPSIVNKFADVRKVNQEIKTILIEARNEYLIMVGLVVGNIPLLYLLNKDWFNTLIYTVPGKAVCGVCGVVILITALLMLKYTKPIEYKR